MKLNTLKLSLLGLASLCFISTSALAVKVPKGTKLADKQEYNVDITTNIVTLDPNLANDITSKTFSDSLFEPLILQDPNTLKYVGAAAESWKVSKDGKTYTFKLRNNTWSDGKPVTAQDFVYAFQRVVDPKVASPMAAYVKAYVGIKNTADIIDGKKAKEELGVRAINSKTLEITLESNSSWFIPAISYSSLSPVRKDIVEKYGDQWTQPKNIVSNGPYTLQENTPNEKAVIVKRNTFWDAKNVHIKKATYNIISNENQRYNRFEAGETNYIDVPRNFLDKVTKDGKKINTIKDQVVFGLKLNLKHQKLQDIRVRKAIAIALDQKVLTKNIIKLNSIPTTTWTPKNANGAQLIENAKWFDYTHAKRAEEARKLLAEAGYSKKNPLTIDLLYPTSEYGKVITIGFHGILQDAFKGALKVNLLNQEWKVYLDTTRSGNYQLSYSGWATLFDDAIIFLSVWSSKNANNSGGYYNPEYDKLLDKYAASKVDAERQKIAKRLDYLVTEQDIGVIPVYNRSSNTLTSPNLGGYSTKVLYNYLRNLYFVK